ncbi:MAG: hypothetical protein K8T26_03270 [Lentisphaerae bacterium]|nr:hypothetical protein [Lentisphaerota bacterium]
MSACHEGKSSSLKMLALFGLACAYVVGLLVVGPRHYLVNDDIGILLCLQDGFAAPFVSVIFGRLLSLAYRCLSPDVGWYGLSLYLLHIVSVFLFLWFLVASHWPRVWRLLLALVYLTFYARFVLAVSYTTTAMMIGAHSLLGFLATHTKSGQSSRASAWLGVGFACAYFLRCQSVIAVAVLALPFLVAHTLSRQVRVTQWLIFIVPLCIAATADGVCRLQGGTEEARAYRTLLNIEHSPGCFIVEIDLADRLPHLLVENGWSSNDYSMVRGYLFPDERKFNEHTFERLRDHHRKSIKQEWTQHVSKAVTDLATDPGYFGLQALVVVWTLAACWRLSPWGRVFAVGSVAYVCATLVLLRAFYHGPARIVIPAVMQTVGLLLQFAAEFGTLISRSKLARVSVALALCVLLGRELADLRRWRWDAAVQCVSFGRGLEKLNRDYSGAFAVVCMASDVQASSLQFQYADPLRPLRTTCDLVFTGWATFSPRYYSTLRRGLGVAHSYEMMPLMLGATNAYFQCGEAQLPLLKTYYLETYGLTTHVARADALGSADAFMIQLAAGLLPAEPRHPTAP